MRWVEWNADSTSWACTSSTAWISLKACSTSVNALSVHSPSDVCLSSFLKIGLTQSFCIFLLIFQVLLQVSMNALTKLVNSTLHLDWVLSEFISDLLLNLRCGSLISWSARILNFTPCWMLICWVIFLQRHALSKTLNIARTWRIQVMSENVSVSNCWSLNVVSGSNERICSSLCCFVKMLGKLISLKSSRFMVCKHEPFMNKLSRISSLELNLDISWCNRWIWLTVDAQVSSTVRSKNWFLSSNHRS